MSYAQGYRGPQAFDEDLHIETVGGAALFTRLDPNLSTERSDSYNISLDYNSRKNTIEFNFVADAFLTHLENPFINSNQVELPNGISVITKRNGSRATVSGLNLEAKMSYSSNLLLQAGATIQSAFYEEEEEIWAPETLTEANRDSTISTDQILRTPHQYGYLTLNYTPDSPFECSVSAVYTGSMTVPHVINPENEYTVLKQTPDFLEVNLKTKYEVKLGDQFYADFSVGIQNLFDSFQEDFDVGAERDAGYIYGPIRPRTFFTSVRFHL
jgi:outer membrane receptor for ferrienterochelin and colicins